MRHAELVAREEKIRSFNIEELLQGSSAGRKLFPRHLLHAHHQVSGSGTGGIFRNFTYDEAHRNSVYFHIPFCPRRCAYCHWVVSVGNPPEERDRYLDAMMKEVRIYKGILGARTISPTSMLIGGGTPSMLSPAQTERFLRSVAEEFDLGKCRQITCEIEPTTILGDEGKAKLLALKKGGVNRISLGVQSFDDGILRSTGRLHGSQDVRDAIRAIREAGFESLSIDLIYGYPGSTLEKWEETLMTAASLGIDAYPLYRLRIVPHGGSRDR
jgi:oxygen-independent coproporphyrinogen-3 oxidase